MLPTDVLLDILKCMDRDELEKIQVTNRAINDMIKRDFAAQPLRLLPDSIVAEIIVRKGELLLSLHRDPFHKWFELTGEYFLPFMREWVHQDDIGIREVEMEEGLWQESRCELFYPVFQMQRFLSENVRFSQVFIVVNSNTPWVYNQNHIDMLESISHIWSDQRLRITCSPKYEPEALDLMFSESSIMQCRYLQIMGCYFIHNDSHGHSDFRHHPNVFAVPVVEFNVHMNGDQIEHVIKERAAFSQSETIIVLSTTKNVASRIYVTLAQEFLKSTNPCRFRVILKTYNFRAFSIENQENLDFYLENAHTNEALQSKQITEQEIEENLYLQWPKSDDEMEERYTLWLLERFPL
ncbi:hypothetical protein Ddc_11623 [Ditylenchus destructor]|nr:hypothetical protein Ddc_11623 [Ditylenchus destructor]